MAISIHYMPASISGVSIVRLYLWADGDDVPVRSFLLELGKSRPNELKRLRVLFNRMAEVGKIINEYQFKDVDGHKPLYEFKANDVRIFCFFDDKKLILVEGDIKKSDKSKDRNRQSIVRAQERARQYKEEKEAGRVEVKQ